MSPLTWPVLTPQPARLCPQGRWLAGLGVKVVEVAQLAQREGRPGHGRRPIGTATRAREAMHESVTGWSRNALGASARART